MRDGDVKQIGLEVEWLEKWGPPLDIAAAVGRVHLEALGQGKAKSRARPVGTLKNGAPAALPPI